ncbi:hypothetical protein FORC88_1454 [Salmonella enterica subsp. enterica serovar Typhimurium]|nr:hypothetical protein FORC88_1454 [Salmonella enterica subsp. enterica serovar Typhimurium]
MRTAALLIICQDVTDLHTWLWLLFSPSVVGHWRTQIKEGWLITSG